MAFFENNNFFCILIPFFFTFICFSNAYNFNVGGKDGWSLHPTENYNQWSARLRFIVNDTLHFKYNAGSDSVMVVNNGDYSSCNTNNPITTLTGGDSVFTLNHSGPFYFISGNKSNCDQGQKLSLVVISPKTKPTLPGAPSPAGISPVPTGSPMGSPGPTISASPMGSLGPSISASPMGSLGPSISASPMGSLGPSISASPMGSPGGDASSSPTGNPADVNAPSPGSSTSATAERNVAYATLSVSIVMIMFWFGLVY